MRSAILPEWWDETCAQDPALLPDIEIRVARFLGVPLSAVRNAATALSPRPYPGAQLRRVRSLDRDRLAPAIHAAIQIAEAVVRSWRDPPPHLELPPPDGLSWRKQIRRASPAVTLSDLLDDLWLRGIPTIPLAVLPTPSFQGAACFVDDRPVILLGYKHDEPGRVAFLAAHEGGHIVGGDCGPDQLVVDGEEEIPDDAEMECKANQYATHVLVGGDSTPHVEGENFKQLASRAAKLERSSGADASGIIFAWASRTGDYATATRAVKALYRGSGARRLLIQHFNRHVDLESATESDRALLRCVYGEPEPHASAD